MNIHFKDKEFFDNLKKSTIAKVKVGSHLYGTNNENSDEDFLYIYPTSENELKSFIWTNNQLQYKEEGIDHNFVSLHSFIRNIINGDSTINFEVLHSKELVGTKLAFLHELKDAFNTYTIIRSYNGFARRDCKFWGKAKTDYEKLKKLGHIIRGFDYAEALIKNEFDFDEINKNLIIKLAKYQSGELELNSNSIKLYNDMIEEQRKVLNSKFEDKTLGLAKLMDIQNANNLHQLIIELQNEKNYLEKKQYLNNFDMSLFINAFENGISYE